MGDSDSEEMEMPVVQKRVTQPSRPVPAVPRVVAPQARRESARPPASLVSAPGTLAKPKMPPPQLMKFTDEDESKIESVRQENERLRGLVTALTSRLELLEMSQKQLDDVCHEVTEIREALESSPAFAKKDRTSALDRSALVPMLKKSSTSDASEILDLIEADRSVYYSGWMNKKGRKVRNWKRRWFVLSGHHLSYYAKEGDKTPLGEINLETCVVDELKAREESGRPCMALLVEGRKLFFCAETPSDNFRWYLYLVCKNAELTYLRKLKHTNQRADNLLLQFLEQPMVTHLRLEKNTLTIDTIVSLTPPIRAHDTLRALHLRYAKLDDLCVNTLAEAIRINHSLEVVDLEGNAIREDGARALASIFLQNSHLRELSLKENLIGDAGVAHLADALVQLPASSAWERLDLTHNQIGANGAAHLAAAWEKTTHTRLTEVLLDDNRVGNAGALRLLEMCAVNAHVNVLHLQNNVISDAGMQSIANQLKKTSTLKRLYLAFNVIQDPRTAELMVSTLLSNRSLEFIEFADYRLESSDLCSLRLLRDCNLLHLPS